VINTKTSEIHNEATTGKHARVTPTSQIRMPAMLPLRTNGFRKLNKKYSVGVPSNDRKLMPNLQKISELLEKFKLLTPRHTHEQRNIYKHTQKGDVKSKLSLTLSTNCWLRNTLYIKLLLKLSTKERYLSLKA
jgi:hypothetical protein